MNELTQNRGQGLLMVIRITVEAAAAFFITAFLLNYGVHCSRLGSAFASLQFIPAVCALGLTVLAFWLAVTLMFGRIYCSTVCPMGALMDLAARTRPRRRVFRYHKALNLLRALSLVSAAVIFATGQLWPRRWVDPYGLFTTMTEAVAGGRVTATALGCAAIAGMIAYVSYRRGRLLCNTLCPVGALLGFVARRSAFHIDINTDLCTQCRRCVDVCKSECIDLNDHVADMSRCVVCFNCLPECPAEAISYTLGRHTLSTPLMQKIQTLKNDKPKTSLACDNTSTSCKTSSTTEPSKPTAPAPEH